MFSNDLSIEDTREPPWDDYYTCATCGDQITEDETRCEDCIEAERLEVESILDELIVRLYGDKQ